MRYFCCEERRLEAVVAHPTLNGIAYLEVLDRPLAVGDPWQSTLFVYLAKPLAAALPPEKVRIEGTPQSRPVRVIGVRLASELVPTPDELAQVTDLNAVLAVRVERPGDFSTYTLRLVAGEGSMLPPDGFDPLLSAVDFSFKVSCLADQDCRAERVCPPKPMQEPALNYLAKDYASFRKLMLDRLALLVPGWREETPADLGMALVDTLAYVGDYLSYRQDAVATEAYLSTARRRVSVRRHARLVDYVMHEGCNARAWVQIRTNADGAQVPKGTQILTRISGLASRIADDSAEYRLALSQAPEVFETMHPATLYTAHNEMQFYTWGARECCLPAGATRATLCGHLPHLKAGDVLVFQERLGPRTGQEADADPARRHAVRLEHVYLTEDPLGGWFLEPQSSDPVQVTQIQWMATDRLPWALCISAVADSDQGSAYTEDVSVALGNIVLADHGQTLDPEDLGTVPDPNPALCRVLLPAGDRCSERKTRQVPPRYRPRLADGPLTWAVPFRTERLFEVPWQPAWEATLDEGGLPPEVKGQLSRLRLDFDQESLSVQGGAGEWSASDGKQACLLLRELEDGLQTLRAYALPRPASATLLANPREALPEIALQQEDPARAEPLDWQPVRDLLSSDAAAREFVVEVESDGTAFLRFGDDQFGQRPNPGSSFSASYRVGNGLRGNVGAGALAHIVSNDSGIDSVSNPLPAQGGTDPEGLEKVRQTAPYAFRRQQRAVTPDDYAEMARCHPEVQNAAAAMRWTGSWYTVFVTVDRAGGRAVDATFEEELRAFLEPYRMAGQDLEIEGPRYVPLEIEMRVCVQPGTPRAEVRQALLERFGTSVLPDGRLGLFHPDNWTFGQTVYLSQIYAEAVQVDGVQSVDITCFQRQDLPSSKGLESGKLVLGRLEIARLDNDPNAPKNGVLRLTMEGGR